MTVARLAISFDKELAREVRRAAGRQPMSSWLADAARRKLRAQGLLEVVREWEAVNGTLLETELRDVRREQGRRKAAK